ncbi:hypothetical protein J1605_021551 [Eschrichtius robustus]|uniref:Nucleosome assembly protein 1-like 1 n=1 Tax=Eschrichtius robustus TaxID=9764 RepID=A0AB34HF53_ESCRO|nr:hypothetical protein J1605_021551 [Eschrichtius robustus]
MAGPLALTLPGTTQGGRDFWRSYNMADIDNKEQSELGQDLDDFEEVEEETGEETKIKEPQLTVKMMQNPQILTALPERPDEEEREWKPDEEDEISEKLKEKAKIEDEKKDKEKEDPKGIPEFWLTVFKNVPESGDLDDAAEAILAAEFEIGHFLRECIILKSVLYFTGEAIEDDDDDDDEEGEVDEVMFTK